MLLPFVFLTVAARLLITGEGDEKRSDSDALAGHMVVVAVVEVEVVVVVVVVPPFSCYPTKRRGMG